MNQNNKDYFKTEKIWKILCKLAPPVMFAQLIQALYNIVDSLYIGRYSEEGLTALSILYPIQLLSFQLSATTMQQARWKDVRRCYGRLLLLVRYL